MSRGAELEAVLFDMDGTLVDSEKVWQAALGDLAARHGATLSERGRVALIGATTAESMSIFHDDIGKPLFDQAEGGRWLEARVMELFAGGLIWRPGAQELLHAIRAAGIKTALVTATARHITESMLDTLGRENFDITVTDDDVTRGKPDPEPYRSAAQRLGVQPANCVAIEDSPTGVTSALGAGCAVLAVPAEVDLSHLTAATHVRSLLDVDLAMLKRLVRQRAGGL